MSYTVIVSENGQGRYQQEIIVNGRHHLVADEPVAVGGDDAGPAPFEFLMSALGACTAMTIRMYAERKELPLTRVSVALRMDRIEVEGKKLDRVEKCITLEGDLDADQRRRLHEIGDRCPTHRALLQPLIIESHLSN